MFDSTKEKHIDLNVKQQVAHIMGNHRGVIHLMRIYLTPCIPVRVMSSCHDDRLTQRPLRGHSEVTQRSLRGHSEVTPRSLRGHSEVIQRSLRGHTEVTQRSHRGHSEVTQRSLRGHTWGSPTLQGPHTLCVYIFQDVFCNGVLFTASVCIITSRWCLFNTWRFIDTTWEISLKIVVVIFFCKRGPLNDVDSIKSTR